MHTITTRAALFATALSAASLPAQEPQPPQPPRTPVLIRTQPELSLLWNRAADRAVLGITLATSSRRDTAGVRIEDVDTNGPAAKAGLKSGDVITDINGVSLRIAAADAEELAFAGIAQRRLQRTIAKAKPGDDVELGVRSGGSNRSVTIKTVSAEELDRTSERRASGARERRPAINRERSGCPSVDRATDATPWDCSCRRWLVADRRKRVASLRASGLPP